MSLKELKNITEKYFQSHQQINLFNWGDIQTYTAISDKEYFAANVDFINASIYNNSLNYNLNITILDLIDVNFYDTIVDAQSNCLEILKDFIAYLEQNLIDYNSININPFFNADGDISAGITSTITIVDYFNKNNCITPTN